MSPLKLMFDSLAVSTLFEFNDLSSENGYHCWYSCRIYRLLNFNEKLSYLMGFHVTLNVSLSHCDTSCKNRRLCTSVQNVHCDELEVSTERDA